MLIIPLSGKVSRHNPPVATIILIAVNCLVFFAFQAADIRHYGEAMEYYVSSGLADREVRAYLEFEEEPIPAELDEKQLMPLTGRMYADESFMRLLRADRVITPWDADFEQWREQRAEYDRLLAGTTAMRYGFVPEKHRPLTIFTHMFLHGSVMHLAGNMIFLWLVGCVLEVGCGRRAYLGIYLLGGMFSVLLFGLVYHDSAVPLVGASGAISALIGAYTVLYGRRKVRVFYSLGFYFDNAELPAIILLPVWLANEFVQLLLVESQVAYVAHMGGLAAGAVLGFLVVRYFHTVDQSVFDEAPDIPALLEEALARQERLDLAGARRSFDEILAIDPHHLETLNQTVRLERLAPLDGHLHSATERLVRELCLTGDTSALYREFSEYVRVCHIPELPSELLVRIATLFISAGYLSDAEKIAGLLLKQRPDEPGLPPMLEHLARTARTAGDADRSRRCLAVLQQTFPEEARVNG